MHANGQEIRRLFSQQKTIFSQPYFIWFKIWFKMSLAVVNNIHAYNYACYHHIEIMIVWNIIGCAFPLIPLSIHKPPQSQPWNLTLSQASKNPWAPVITMDRTTPAIQFCLTHPRSQTAAARPSGVAWPPSLCPYGPLTSAMPDARTIAWHTRHSVVLITGTQRVRASHECVVLWFAVRFCKAVCL